MIGLSPLENEIKDWLQKSSVCQESARTVEIFFLLFHLNSGAPGEAVDGHILAFSNCYMLFFFRLQTSVPEESLALFLEPK